MQTESDSGEDHVMNSIAKMNEILQRRHQLPFGTGHDSPGAVDEGYAEVDDPVMNSIDKMKKILNRRFSLPTFEEESRSPTNQQDIMLGELFFRKVIFLIFVIIFIHIFCVLAGEQTAGEQTDNVNQNDSNDSISLEKQSSDHLQRSQEYKENIPPQPVPWYAVSMKKPVSFKATGRRSSHN